MKIQMRIVQETLHPYQINFRIILRILPNVCRYEIYCFEKQRYNQYLILKLLIVPNLIKQ